MIEILNPKIIIEKAESPIIFVDTFMWIDIFTKEKEIRELLEKCCKENILNLTLTNAIQSELKQRKIYNEVINICENTLTIVPMERISANQIIHSLLCFFKGKNNIRLDWNLAISDVPVLGNVKIGLKRITDSVKDELNLAVNNYTGTKENLVSIIVDVEREIWKEALKV